MTIHILDDETRICKLAFTEKSKIKRLLEDEEFSKIDCPSKVDVQSDDKLLIAINGNPYIKKVYKHSNNDTNNLVAEIGHKNTFFVVQDLHEWTCDWETFYEKYKDCNIITTYNKVNPLKQYNVQMHAQHFWIPHHLNTEQYKDWKQPQKNQILMFGSHNLPHYPERKKLKIYFERNFRRTFKRIGHPGYNCKRHQIHTSKLSKQINASRVCCVSPSKYSYVVAKYFETIMSKTVPIGYGCPDADDLNIRVLPHTKYNKWQDYPLEEQYNYLQENFNLDKFCDKIKNIILNY